MNNQSSESPPKEHNGDSRTTPNSTSSPSWSYLSAIVLGLLSSSCCVIQLLLNMFSVGCAGFSILTPMRPVFVAISWAMIAYTIHKYRLSSRTALTLIIALTLTVSPEIVSLFNQSGTRGVVSTFSGSALLSRLPPFAQLSYNVDKTLGRSKWTAHKEHTLADLDSSRPSILGLSLVKYEVQVDGMACEACANRLRQHFTSQPGIESVKVFFSEKKLEIWTRSDPNALMLSERHIQDMVADVDSKYSATLLDRYSDTLPTKYIE